MTTRRRLLVALGAAVLAMPLGARAQKSDKVSRIGFLSGRRRPDALNTDAYGAFFRGLRDLGYTEGKNLKIDWRFADGKFDRLPGLAVELVAIPVDVLVAAGTPAARAAQKATSTIPIVFSGVGDPIGVGLVGSLARPESNVTGLSLMTVDVSMKMLELLAGVVPKLSIVAVLLNPTNPLDAIVLRQIQTAAGSIGMSVTPHEATNEARIEAAFNAMATSKERPGGLITVADPLFVMRARQIADLAAKYRLPAIYSFREHVVAGGLMCYGQNLAEHYGRAAAYVDKILRGTKTSALPVEQSTKLELVINRKTAKALGLTIPPELLVQADKVIE